LNPVANGPGLYCEKTQGVDSVKYSYSNGWATKHMIINTPD